MDPKLTLLFLVIGTIVGLSNLGREGEGRLRGSVMRKRLRQIVRDLALHRTQGVSF